MGSASDLAVWASGPEEAPVVLCVHGYPDDHTVWDGVAEALSGRFRVVRYDLRGFAGSSAAEHGFAYEILTGDVAAVADRHGGSVHLVGHDWGSIIGWLAVTDSDARGRIRSYTSISGPHPALYRDFLGTSLRSGVRGVLSAAGQALRSSYGAVFQIPALPEALVDLVPAGQWAATLRRGGVPEGDPMLDVDEDALHQRMKAGLGLYRNAFRQRADVPAAGSVGIPVQVVVPTRDSYLREGVLLHRVEEVAPGALIRRLPTGHWAMRSHPATIADWIAELAESADAGGTSVRRAHGVTEDVGRGLPSTYEP